LIEYQGFKGETNTEIVQQLLDSYGENSPRGFYFTLLYLAQALDDEQKIRENNEAAFGRVLDELRGRITDIERDFEGRLL
jgi:hypothetical protein